MIEVEVKIPIENIEKIKQKLLGNRVHISENRCGDGYLFYQ